MKQEINLTGTITIGRPDATLQEITVRSKPGQEQTVLPEQGYDGFSKITVRRTPLTTKVLTPDVLKHVYNASADDVQGYSQVTMKSCYPLTISNNEVTGVTIPNMDIVLPAEVTTIGNNAFYKNPILKSISGSNVLTVSQNAFRDSTIENFNLPNVATIGVNAFNNCKKLPATITLPNVTTIGAGAFENCKNTIFVLPSVMFLAGYSLGSYDLTDIYLGFDGVVQLNGVDFKSPIIGDYNLNVTVHVPANQLANYQADTTWQQLILDLADNDTTLTIVGDYVV